MAATLFKALAGIGLKTTAFLQSLFLFPFGLFLQALRRFQLTGQPNQPTLPSSTSSSAEPAELHHNGDHHDTNTDHSTTDMTGGAPLSSAASAPQDAKAPVPKIVPALPRIPPAKKDTCCPPPPKASSPAVDGAQLTDGLSRLDINGIATAAAPLQTTVNGTENGTAKDAAAAAAAAAVAPQQQYGLDCASGGGGEVTRAPPVVVTPAAITTPTTTATTTTIELDGDTVQIQSKVETREQAAEKAMHSRFMREALDMARLALRTNETPVGCVLVYEGRVIARGMNATNVSRNGTRHAELMALSALLSYSPESDIEPAKSKSPENATGVLTDKTNEAQPAETSTWGDVDPRDGHLYPYGQKLHPSPRVDPSVISECTLYVTVEPCVMCASLLRQFKIKKVYFGAVNDKFGGTGGVFRVHMNSPYSMTSAPASPAPQVGKGLARPAPECRPASTDGTTSHQAAIKDENDVYTPVETANLPGDGGNVERGYEAEGGWGRDEAVTLLRQFYVQENNRAPVPRKKEGRAARLAAMMQRDGHAGGPMLETNTGSAAQENSESSTSENQSPTAEDAPEATAITA